MKEPSTSNAGNQAQKPAEPSFGELERASEELKQKIDEQRRKHAMPINSSLGNPDVDARNADGHNDLPDDPDE